MSDILDTIKYLVNKEVEEILFTGNVTSLDPLQVKLSPSDDAINVRMLNVFGIKVGSNVLMIKYLNKFVVIGVIGNVPAATVKVVVKQSSQGSTTSASFTTDSELQMIVEANKMYKVDFNLIVSCASETPDMTINFDNTGTVTLYGQIHMRSMSVSGTNPAAYEYGKSATYSNFSDAMYIGLDPNYGSARFSFLVKGGATGGAITLLFSQRNTDGSNAAYVRVGSYIEYKEVEEV
jgi:hypothetical protein